MRKWTFHSLCAQLKSNRDLNDSAEDLNTLIGAASSLLGESTTEGLAGFIGALAEKDKLISLCGNILEALLSRKPEDYSGRVDQMREAYGILCFTAFFDELDKQLPDGIRKSIQLGLPEKKSILGRSGGRKAEEHQARLDIVLPDIMLERGTIDTFLEETYWSMATALRTFTDGLSFRETASERDIRTFEEILNGLPEAAVRRFHSQYLVLCAQFNEFYIFMQSEQLAQQKRKWDERYQAILTAAAGAKEPIEAGLASLENLILDLPDRVKEQKVREIAGEIMRKYRSDIECPLIGAQEQASADDDLRYPLISEGFIPQAYKLLKYSGSEHLELPKTWEPLAPRQDMMSFWAGYCLDPGSTEGLLLILGEPGGGKSLLTKVLCARMCAPASMFVRIPLRDHDVEDEIENIVCRQISFDGDASEQIPTFKWFTEGSPDAPITLVFDGYDEVLQATGGVYRTLLNKIQKFQDRCRNLRRPVRVIVTSRETLIDKAEIPEGTMVMKLLEFDGSRKNQWISIWNAHNHTILSEAGIGDFSLPENSQDIDELSSQPLLLMMLAMYDADFETGTNALKPKGGQVEKLDRTKLYDELLRRFVRRELRKGHRGNEIPFDEREEAEKNILVDEEMRKLGIAALGMFVREKLSLEVGELDNDLEYMGTKFPDYDTRNTKMLKNAEVFLGSFFFIHDPRRKNDPDEKKAAFEFLHKTFYEFLVADFILQNLLDAVDEMDDIRSARKNGETNYRRSLDRPDFFCDAYYAALGGAFLCMEPEIIQMVAEWKGRKSYARFENESYATSQIVDQVMEDIFQSHMSMIRNGTFQPDAWVKGGLSGERSCPQACAIYLLDLLILRVLLQGQCRIKIEDWHFISQFVRLNAPPPKKKDTARSDDDAVFQERILPSEEIILKFMALFQLRQKGDTVLIEKRAQVQEVEQQSLLEARINIFDFAQDTAARAICKLHDTTAPFQEKQMCQENLYRQGFRDLEFERRLLQLKDALLNMSPVHFPPDLVQAGIACLLHREIEPSLTLEWLLCIQQLIRMGGLTFPMKYREQRLHEQFRAYTHDPSIDSHSWKLLRDVVFTRYIDYVVIIQTFLAVIKEIGCSAMLLEDRDFIRDVIPKLAHRPKQFSVLFMAIADAIPMCLSVQGNYSILSIIDQLVLDDSLWALTSTKGATAILKVYSMTFRPSDRTRMTVMSDDIVRLSLKCSLDYPSEDLPELLRVCLQMGYFQEVKNFFADLPSDWIHQLLGKYPYVVGELFDISKVVRKDQAFLRCIAPRIDREWREVYQYPDVFMKLLLQSIQDRKAPEHVNVDIWISHFLVTYREMFEFDMDNAVYLLYLIFKRNPTSENFESAYMYSVMYYQSLLERSVRGAARLLTMFEKMKGTRKQIIIKQMENAFVPAFSIRRCFNKAMSIRDRRSVSQLMELLDSMVAEERAALAGYFAEQRPYLRAYSYQLSRKIEEIYQ